MATPSEHIEKQVDSGHQWLMTAIAVQLGKSRGAETRRLAEEASRAAYEARRAYLALIAHIDLDDEEDSEEADDERQLHLPLTAPLPCLIRGDTCEHSHCHPEASHGVCRSMCGVGVRLGRAQWPALRPIDESWRSFLALALDGDYDPETGEVITDDSVAYHRPLFLGGSAETDDDLDLVESEICDELDRLGVGADIRVDVRRCDEGFRVGLGTALWWISRRAPDLLSALRCIPENTGADHLQSVFWGPKSEEVDAGAEPGPRPAWFDMYPQGLRAALSEEIDRVGLSALGEVITFSLSDDRLEAAIILGDEEVFLPTGAALQELARARDGAGEKAWKRLKRAKVDLNAGWRWSDEAYDWVAPRAEGGA